MQHLCSRNLTSRVHKTLDDLALNNPSNPISLYSDLLFTQF